MKYFVVSDVHDHCDLLQKALESNGFDEDNENHRLIICGDAFYSGPQPGELFVFLHELHNKGKLIFVRGNHDLELLDNLNNGRFGRKANRTCAALIVKRLTERTDLTDEELIAECSRLGFTQFLSDVPVWHYETDHYVFCHGFIPTVKKQYDPDWRGADEKRWRSAVTSDGMYLSMRCGISEPNKTIVFGHYSTARCRLMQNASEKDWEDKIYTDQSKISKLLKQGGYLPFYGNTFIAMDQSVKKTGFINCIVLENTC